MPGTTASSLLIFIHLVTPEVGTIIINSNFTDEETEALRGWMRFQRPQK